MLTRTLGTWQIAGNPCTATLAIDRPRSINISLEWGREPGPTEIEHLDVTLPDIIEAALGPVEQFAAICESLLELIADGRICRVGIKDGLFVYAGTPELSGSDSSSPAA
jgi:hypothetical protein